MFIDIIIISKMELDTISSFLDNASKFIIISEDLSKVRENLNKIDKEVPKVIPQNKELEIRFGKKSREGLITGVSPNDFLETFQNLQKIGLFTREYTKVQTYQEGRIIKYYDSYTLDKEIKTLYQQKNNISKYDQEINKYTLRVSYSDENEIEEFKPKSLPRYYKTQQRYKFDFKLFEFHLSEIKEYDLSKITKKDVIDASIRDFEDMIEQKPVKYEVEVEIKDSTRLLDIIKFCLVIITNSLSNLNQDTRNKLIGFNKNYIYNFRNIKKDYDKNFFDNKPITLSLGNIDSIKENYRVTNKLDGVHYNLVFSSKGAYLINSTEIMLVARPEQSNYTQLWSNDLKFKTTILDGELVFDAEKFKYYFYVFDSIIIREEEVANTEKQHSKRIQMAYDIIDHFNSYEVNNLLKIEYKTFFDSGNMGTDIRDCVEFIKKKYGDEYEDKDDGLIFVPSVGEYNSVLYKWKFPKRITLDGKIKFLRYKTKYEKEFAFLFKTNTGNNSLKDQDNKPILLSVKNDNFLFDFLSDEMIVEAEYNSNTKEFNPTRIRSDKTYPNFITTAISTYKEMRNPINEKDLISYFKKDEIKKVSNVEEERVVEKKEEKNKVKITEARLEEEKANALKNLSVDIAKKISTKFTSPMIRIGMIGEGNCFVHAILFSLVRSKYSDMSESQRMAYAKAIRKKMSDSLQIARWASLGKGSVAIFLTEQELFNKLSQIQVNEYDEYYKKFKSESENIFFDYISFMKEKYPVVKDAYKEAFEKYKRKLNSCEFFDESMFEYATIFFDCNIIIVRDISREPENSTLEYYDRNKKTIFILNLSSKFSYLGSNYNKIDHFEALGVMEDGEVTALFNNEDDCVKNALNYVRERKEKIMIEEVSKTKAIEQVIIQEKVLDPLVRTHINELFDLYFMGNKDKLININIVNK